MCSWGNRYETLHRRTSGHGGLRLGAALSVGAGRHAVAAGRARSLDLLCAAVGGGNLYRGRETGVLRSLRPRGWAGIHANNTYPADFLPRTFAIATNTIHAAFQQKVPRLLFLGSSCIYPRQAPQPMPEECLLTGPLEGTNEAYAIAKTRRPSSCARLIASNTGVLFYSAMPTNLYGPGDNYHVRKTRTCCRRSSAAFMRRGKPGRLRSALGARAPRGGNSCTWTISRTPARSC